MPSPVAALKAIPIARLIAAAEVAPYGVFRYSVDLCNADAVRAFLQTTKERYADLFWEAGKTPLTG